MFFDLTLMSFGADDDGADDDNDGDDGASDGGVVSTDKNDDTSAFVIDGVLDGADANAGNATDDGDNENCESNDAVATDVVTEEDGIDVVVGNDDSDDDTAFLCDSGFPRIQNTVKLSQNPSLGTCRFSSDV